MPHHDTTSSVQCDAGSGSVACRTVRNFPNTGALLLSRTRELFCDTMINNKGNILLYILNTAKKENRGGYYLQEAGEGIDVSFWKLEIAPQVSSSWRLGITSFWKYYNLH